MSVIYMYWSVSLEACLWHLLPYKHDIDNDSYYLFRVKSDVVRFNDSDRMRENTYSP